MDETNVNTPSSPGDNETDRVKYVASLVKSGRKEDAVELKQIALNDASSKVRYYAKKGLLILKRKFEKQKGAATIRTVSPEKVGALLKNPHPAKRMSALKAIVQYQLAALVADVADQVGDEPDIKVKATMASLLGRMGTREHVRLLLPLLKDDDARIRANTIAALGRLGIEDAALHIVPLLKDEDNRCRANAISVLREMGNDEVVNTLKEMLNSPEVHMQESAAFVLDVFPFETIQDLIPLGAKSEFKMVRNRVRGILEQFADQGIDQAAVLFMSLFPDEEDAGAASEKSVIEKDEAQEIFERLEVLESMSAESRELQTRQEVEDRLVDDLAGLSQETFGSYEDIVRREDERINELQQKLGSLEDSTDDTDSRDEEDAPNFNALKELSGAGGDSSDFSFEREIDIKPALESVGTEQTAPAERSEEIFEMLKNIG